jgi:hypothetical protein
MLNPKLSLSCDKKPDISVKYKIMGCNGFLGPNVITEFFWNYLMLINIQGGDRMDKRNIFFLYLKKVMGVIK